MSLFCPKSKVVKPVASSSPVKSLIFLRVAVRRVRSVMSFLSAIGPFKIGYPLVIRSAVLTAAAKSGLLNVTISAGFRRSMPSGKVITILGFACWSVYSTEAFSIVRFSFPRRFSVLSVLNPCSGKTSVIRLLDKSKFVRLIRPDSAVRLEIWFIERSRSVRLVNFASELTLEILLFERSKFVRTASLANELILEMFSLSARFSVSSASNLASGVRLAISLPLSVKFVKFIAVSRPVRLAILLVLTAHNG